MNPTVIARLLNEVKAGRTSTTGALVVLIELERENIRLREVGDRMAAMLGLSADATVEEWPDDDKIMSVLSDWRSSPNAAGETRGTVA